MKGVFALSGLAVLSLHSVFAQSLGNAGTIEGIVTDPSGATVPKAEVSVHNTVNGYNQTVLSGPDGSYRLTNIPPNPYHLQITAAGFNVFSQDVDIRNAIPVQVKAMLTLGAATTTVTLESEAEALETDPSAHVDTD